MMEAARESFSRAIELNPSYEEAYYNLGLAFREKDLPAAIRSYEKALELDIDYAEAHRELGWALGKLNEFDKAEAQYHIRRAIELDHVDGWAYIYLGNLLWGDLDLSSAEQAFLQAIEVWPADSVPLWCLALFYERTDRTREAESYYEKALQSSADDPQANLRFGLYLKEVGESARAKTYLTRALELDPENYRAASALATLDSPLPDVTGQ
jgi:tetratricopeptide (TPR) repeat protein